MPNERLRDIFGNQGEEIQPYIDALGARGISVSTGTIEAVRGGRVGKDWNYGADILRRDELAQFREQGNAGLKIENYLAIGEAGLQARGPQAESGRYRRKGFRRPAIEQLGITAQSHKAIRLDIVCSEMLEDEFLARELFVPVATQYLKAYTSASPRVSEAAVKIDNKWNHEEVADFYRALYLYRSSAVFNAWAHFEAEFIVNYYQVLLAGDHHFSPFDRFALKAVIGSNVDDYADLARRETGILANDDTIHAHIKALTSPLSKKEQKVDSR